MILGDTLILKNEKVYKGKLVKYVDGKMVMFKALPSANILINISEVQKLTLTDGTKIFENNIKYNDFNDCCCAGYCGLAGYRRLQHDQWFPQVGIS